MQAFLLSRRFNAPRERVFSAWTDPHALAQWFCPAGMTMIASQMDLRPGGCYHYGMRTADGHEMWGKWAFREIIQPECVVMVNSFSDRDGGTTRHPMSPTWPLKTLSATRFEAQGDQTVLHLSWLPFDADAAEQATFDGAHDGMRQGWSSTMAQLDAYLSQTSK